jgi:ribonuclease-3
VVEHGIEGRGEGRSRRAAEQEAARLVLDQLSRTHE